MCWHQKKIQLYGDAPHPMRVSKKLKALSFVSENRAFVSPVAQMSIDMEHKVDDAPPALALL